MTLRLIFLLSIVWKYCMDESFHDHKKAFTCGKRPWSRKKPWLVEIVLDERIIFVWEKFSWWRKNLALLKKTFSIKENSLLVENFLDEGKIFVCGKLPWWRKSLHLLKASFMNRISLLEENFLDEEKLFDCGKRPWWRKTLGLWWLPWWRKNFYFCKISLMKLKSWLVEKLCYCGKIIVLSLLKMKSSNKENACVETINIYF